MEIRALQKTTLVDYPGNIAVTVFVSGCNFRCCFCHNPSLIDRGDIIEEKYFFDFLAQRKGLIDGVCITGGEPTIQSDLISFIEKIKKENFLVKLDTNGSNPNILESLFKEKLLDYIAMDIKCGLEKYSDFIFPEGAKRPMEFHRLLKKIQKSINLIKNSNIDYEFRTTVVPNIVDRKEIKKIGELLDGSKAYYLQQFRNENTLDKKWRKIQPYPDEELKQMIEIAKPYFDKVDVRGT
ncbi:anaerobic ribonucleoside-triphosphate reductase activating protein [Patescibacteria group bacterium]